MHTVLDLTAALVSYFTSLVFVTVELKHSPIMSRFTKENKHITQEKQTQSESDLPVQDAESLHSELMLRAKQEGIQPAFLAKVTVLNTALADIGMGRYNGNFLLPPASAGLPTTFVSPSRC